MARPFCHVLINTFRTHYRARVKFILELLIILLCLVVAVINPVASNIFYELTSDVLQKTIVSKPDKLDSLAYFKSLMQIMLEPIYYSLAYTPNVTFATTIVQNVVQKLKLYNSIPFHDEEIMRNSFKYKTMLATISFRNVDGSDVPEHLDVAIEFPYNFRTYNTYFTSKVLWSTRCMGKMSTSTDIYEPANVDFYLREGFLQLQNAIFLEWYALLGAKLPSSFAMPDINLRWFSHSITSDICRPAGTSNLTGFLFSFMFLLPFLNLIWRYGRETEANLLVHHWRFGCNYVLFWFAHFIVAFMHLLLLDVVVMAVLKINWFNYPMNGSFDDCNLLGFFVFLALYSISLIVFVMLLVSSRRKGKDCVYIGITLWLLAFCVLFTTLKYNTSVFSPLLIISSVLFFQSSFVYGLNLVKNTKTLTIHSDLLILFAYMLANIILNLILLIVVTQSYPGRYLDWRKNIKPKGHKPSTISLREPAPSWHNFEFGPVGSVDIIRMKNVCTYITKNKVQGLKNVSMRIYKDEITVMLGPDYCGKKTLLQVLAGLKQPEIGDVHFDDRDMYKEWSEMKNEVDVTMDNNLFIDLLTADETLRYHLRMKKRKLSALLVAEEMTKWYYILKPYIPQMNTYTKKLSYDQKCLLCLCCVMCGGTRLILLNQPTRYMSRSFMVAYWNILQLEKIERVIVFSTCSVEEAETLGDRIGVLIAGSLKAYGTPFFIKTKYGVGYNLIISKASNVSSRPITEMLNKFIPDILPENEVGDQLIYKISAKRRPAFQRILMYIEREGRSLGIDNIRITGSDMGEAYMTIDKRPSNQFVSAQNKVRVSVNQGDSFVAQQFYAMLYKKLLFQAPNVIPLIMVAVSVIIIIVMEEVNTCFQLPLNRSNAINLGFPSNLIERPAYFDKMTGCTFVEITKLNMGPLYETTNTVTRTFEDGSFRCEHETYNDFILKPKIFEKFGGVEMAENNYTAWFNQGIFHTAAVSLNLLHNLILKEAYPTNPKVMMTVVNDPALAPLCSDVQLLDQKKSHFGLPITVGIIIPIATSSFILFVAEERRSHMLQLQIMAGIRLSIYWMVNFIWDWGTYLAYIFVFIVVMIFSTIKGFFLLEKLLIILIICVYGCISLLMVYLISFFVYQSLLRAYLLTLIIQLIYGLIALIAYWEVVENSLIFYYIALASPPFCLLNSLSDVNAVFLDKEECRQKCMDIKHCNSGTLCHYIPLCCEFAILSWFEPGIMTPMICMVVVGLILAILMLVVHFQRKDSKFAAPKHLKQYHSSYHSYEDKDVLNIKQYIANADMRECRQYRMVADQVEDRIPDNTKELQTISFALDKSVCMGIFGTHKSGKSHLIKQLIGEHGFCYGDVYVKTTELKYELNEVYKHISYCPQECGYFKLFKPRDLLHIFCLIGGIRANQIPERIREIALSLNIYRYLGRPIKLLSFEKRRKVSIAIALILNRDVIILDEPTRGLPAYTRREIWNVLRFQRFCEKTIIVATTDRMECEALTDFVIYFDQGQMLALGSVQYLSQKYVTGFFLEIKLKRVGATAYEANTNFNRDVENLNRFITYLHEDSEVWSRVDNMLKYYVPVKQPRFSHLFSALEKNKRNLNISDYTISQGTMVDVMRAIFSSRQSYVSTSYS